MKRERPQHPNFDAAIKVKRTHPSIDMLVSDTALHDHLWSRGGLDGSHKLTLGTALALNSPIAGSLEIQLVALLPHMWQGRTKPLIDNLLNDSEQFRNTRAELGFAMWLLGQGAQVRLGEVFHDGKDVDVVVSDGISERFVDVISLASETVGAHDGFADLDPDRSVAKQMWGKVVTKYNTKFKAAKEAGWDGSAWVALNYAQNESLFLEQWLRTLLGKPAWQDEVAEEIKKRAPELDGVVYFAYMGNVPSCEPPVWMSLK